MKKFLFIVIIALLCCAKDTQAQFLIDDTYMGEYNPIVTTYTKCKKQLNNGATFDGEEERANNNLTGYRGTLYQRDGSFLYGTFDIYFRPINYGWYVKDNVPYFRIYDNNGNYKSSRRVETGGRKFWFLDHGEYGIRFFDTDYSSGNNYNNNNYNSNNHNSGSSHKARTAHPKTCTKCIGRKTCTTCSGRGYYKPNIRGGYITCSVCGGTGKCRLCSGTGQHGHTWY